MPDPAIRISNAGIKYHLNLEKEVHLRRDGLRAVANFIFRRRVRDFWALRDVSLEVGRGEIVGVIGGNGAGKSTLLKIMAGILPATEGRVEVQGTVAPLIELGAAINPELTGAENIYLAGSIYRIPRRQIRRDFSKIVDFSGISGFIRIPVKNYSSGMFIRLAFSTIIFFHPDIVLIDEVFAVGDEAFQKKSFEKILSFKERGAAIVLVSHDLNLINQICGRVLVLDKGRTVFLGDPGEAVGRYLEIVRGETGIRAGDGAGDEAAKAAPPPEAQSKRWGNLKVEITDVSFVDSQGRKKAVFRMGDYFEARISYVSRLAAGEKVVFGAAINTDYRMLVYGPNTLKSEVPQEVPERGTVRFIVPSLPLFRGGYTLSVSAYDPTLTEAYDHHEQMYEFRISESPTREFGTVRIQTRWEIE